MATSVTSSANVSETATASSPAVAKVQILCNEEHRSLIQISNGENIRKTLVQICMFSGQNYDPNILASQVDNETRTCPTENNITMPLSKVPIAEGEELFILRISPNPKDPNFFKRLLSALLTLEQTACSSTSDLPNPEFSLITDAIKKATLKRLIGDWQCCNGCNNGCVFPFGNEDTAIMVNFILRNGGTVLCADFALKSLIKQGINIFQGVNPFVQTGQTSSRNVFDDGLYKVRYDPKKLLDCGSPQLQAIATMNTNGKVLVKFQPCTIQYDILPGAYEKLQSLGCEMTVLTYVCTCKPYQPQKRARISPMSFPSSATEDDTECVATATPMKEVMVDEDVCTCAVPANLNEGMKNVGHTMIKFPSGGVCFVANCHWGNLKPDSLGASQEQLEEYMTQTYGASFTQEYAESPANLQLEILTRVMSSRTPSCN